LNGARIETLDALLEQAAILEAGAIQRVHRMRLLQHSALIIAFLGLSLIQKVDWEWRVALPSGGEIPHLNNGGKECPVPQIISSSDGFLRKIPKPQTEPGSPLQGLDAEFYLVTGYAVGDGNTPGQVTADGRLVRPGITVACPKELALGHMIYIDGIGPRVCEDRGSAIVGKRLDVAFKTPEAALLFGKRWMRVGVIR